MIGLELVILGLIVLMNGFFAMSEAAMVSSRRPLLQQLAARGDERARAALTVVDNPSRFLAVLQIGATLSAILAGVFSGATIAVPVGAWLDRFALFAHHGRPVAFVLVVAFTAYASLLLGELAPKQIALAHAEAIVLRIAALLLVLARVAAPAVWLLDRSTRIVLRLAGVHPVSVREVTEEEVRSVVAAGAESGAILAAEREMIDGVLFLANRAVRTIMTPRPDVAWLDLQAPREEALRRLRDSPHHYVLVGRGSIDDVVGVLDKQALLDSALGGQPFDLEAALQSPLVIHEGASILRTLDLFKKTPAHTAAVIDEYGVIQGIVTRTNLLEAIAGDLPSLDPQAEPQAVRRDDGSMLLDATLPIEEAADLIGLRDLSSSDFLTLAGFMLAQFNHVPQAGEHFTWAGRRFEVVRMEGRRIDKVLVLPGAKVAETPA